MHRTRTAKSCGPDASTLASTRDNANALRGDGDKKPIAGESTKQAVKTIAQGRPGISGEPVVTNLRVFYFYTQGCGCAEAPGFPCALYS
jgi:hypothetical protein